jgi:type IV pilus assembly protein PilV
MDVAQSNKKQSGIAMLEVIIAIAVVAFGFFALLKLQITTLSNINIANQRYVAANLAVDMGERIRANSSNYASYTNSGCGGVCGVDYTDWNNALSNSRNSLPNASAKVETTTSPSVIITISWDEKTPTGVEVATYSLEVPINVL